LQMSNVAGTTFDLPHGSEYVTSQAIHANRLSLLSHGQKMTWWVSDSIALLDETIVAFGFLLIGTWGYRPRNITNKQSPRQHSGRVDMEQDKRSGRSSFPADKQISARSSKGWRRCCSPNLGVRSVTMVNAVSRDSCRRLLARVNSTGKGLHAPAVFTPLASVVSIGEIDEPGHRTFTAIKISEPMPKDEQIAEFLAGSTPTCLFLPPPPFFLHGNA
jgi:hypothetical protein